MSLNEQDKRCPKCGKPWMAVVNYLSTDVVYSCQSVYEISDIGREEKNPCGRQLDPLKFYPWMQISGKRLKN